MSNFNKLCRACLTTIDSLKYTFNVNVSPDDYFFCTSIEIAKDEVLPKALCHVCYDLLSKLTEFKRSCIYSNNILLTCSSIKCEENVLSDNSKVFNNESNATNNSENEHWLDNESIKECSEKINYNNAVNVKHEISDNNDCGNDVVFADLAVLIPVKKNKGDKRTEVSETQKSVSLTKRKKYACEICHKKFVCFDRFETHKKTHVKKLPPKCVPCNKEFVTWSGLRRHNINWHSLISLINFKCRTCGKITTSRESLAEHQKLHKQRRLYICNVCGRSYASNTNLESHLDTHKDNRERQFTCDLCGKNFLTRQCIVSHISRCHTGKRFICEICSFPFTDKHNLAKHLQKHEGKLKLYTCKVCDKSFTAKQVFVEHERIHSGERPFQCKYCPKSFISRKRVTDHHRTHTGEKPYKCEICNHLFTQRGSLTRHMKIHDRPPYQVT